MHYHLKILLGLLLVQVACSAPSSAVIYEEPAPGYHSFHTPTLHAVAPNYHEAYTIVAPLTKLAHVTYDSVPISHTPLEHMPLFQRVSHVKARRN